MRSKINSLEVKDCLEYIKEIEDESVTLCFTSPPYNVKLDYSDYNDDLKYKQYLNWLKDIFIETKRVLRDGGRLVINIDAITNIEDEDADKTEYVRNIYTDLSIIMRDIKMKFRGEHAWFKQNTPGKKTAWGSWKSCSNPIITRNHEYVLVWCKDNWKLPRVSEDSDLTKEEFMEYVRSAWEVVPQTKKKADHPAAFPEELAKRVIKLHSYPGDIVLDPFMGTGTTAVVAKRYKRNYLGCDISEKYIKFAKERINCESQFTNLDSLFNC